MEGHKRQMPTVLANDIELTSHLLQEDVSPSNTPSPISDEFRIPQPHLSTSTSHGNVQYNQQPSCNLPHLGIFMAVLSSFCFSVCSLIVKQMKDMNPIELAMYRFAGILLPTLPILFYKNLNPFPRGKRMMLVLRAILGCTSLMSQFYAIRYMPLADASVIIFSVPVFVAVFARIFLKEHFGLIHCVTIFCTLLGCTLIAKPPALFGYLDDEHSSNMSFTVLNRTKISNATIREEEELNMDPQFVFIGAVVALIGTIFAANVYVVVRALKELHFSVIMASFGFLAFIQTFTVTAAIGELALPPTLEDWLLLFLLAFFSFGGQILLTMALHREQAGPVSIARSADIIFAFIWQMLFFHQIPTWLSIVGALLVTCSVFLVAAKKWVEGLPNDSKLRRRLIYLLY